MTVSLWSNWIVSIVSVRYEINTLSVIIKRSKWLPIPDIVRMMLNLSLEAELLLPLIHGMNHDSQYMTTSFEWIQSIWYFFLMLVTSCHWKILCPNIAQWHFCWISPFECRMLSYNQLTRVLHNGLTEICHWRATGQISAHNLFNSHVLRALCKAKNACLCRWKKRTSSQRPSWCKYRHKSFQFDRFSVFCMPITAQFRCVYSEQTARVCIINNLFNLFSLSLHFMLNNYLSSGKYAFDMHTIFSSMCTSSGDVREWSIDCVN